mmetsp:Transcript_7386/g.11267  ORF Transcript_7386/g.11267 Transcript_7386/m.11267 type:complete len:432 (-) Transcript_7386:46-1341(-)
MPSGTATTKKQEIVTRMKKESDLIKHHSGLADSNLAVFNERLNDLEMQLNTVTIKIAETSENRHNYELNITHLKEEDFDNFNKLEALRKQNQENNSFFKKMSELKIQAIDDKERAESELAEFRKEIGNYQDFVGNQLSQFQVILDIVRQQNDKREKAKITKSEALREKINRRIVTLEEEAQAAEKEAGGLTSRLTSLDLKLRHFEDSFQKITAATGLTNPESIVNKYFFKTEIRDQLQAEIEDKQSACAKLVEEKAALEDELAKAKAEFKEDTWADVEKLLEGGREADFRAAKGQGTNDSSAMTLAFAQEGLMSLLKNCCEVQESELEADVEAATGQLWSAELSSVVFTRMHESLDMLLETEQEYVQMHEAELARKKEEEAEKSAKAKAVFGLDYSAVKAAVDEPADALESVDGGGAAEAAPVAEAPVEAA